MQLEPVSNRHVLSKITPLKIKTDAFFSELPLLRLRGARGVMRERPPMLRGGGG